MYKSLYTLKKYNLQEYKKKLQHLITIPKLEGINGETLCYVLDSELKDVLDLVIRAYTSLNTSPSINKEVLLLDSHSSATIEGAKTTIEKVKRAVKSKNPSKDDLMVTNVMSATSFALNHGIKSEEDLLHVWRLISRGVIENKSKQGTKYRSGMVYIGNDVSIVHTPCHPKKIQDKMSRLICFINKDLNLLDTIIAHFYYVYVHPMCDGNGRTARVLQTALLNQIGMKGIKSLPWISELNRTLPGYYSSLRESELAFELNGKSCIDLSPFISYILEVLYSSTLSYEKSKNTLTKTESLIVTKMSQRGKHTEITVTNACKLLKINDKDSARKVLNSLCDKGYLSKRKQGTKNIYTLL